LVKREFDSIARDAASVRGAAPGDPGAALTVLRARARVEESTGASLACPTWFRATIADAKRKKGGYAAAGYALAKHGMLGEAFDSDQTGPQALAAILEDEKLSTAKAARKLVEEWMRDFLPRCYELVPPAKRGAFAEGIASAIDEGELA